MACPDTDCHQKVLDTCRLIHSEKEGLPSKVSKASATKWAVTIIGYLVVVTLAVMGAWSMASTERKQNKQDIAVIGESICNMKELLHEIKANQVTKGDIYRAIKSVQDDK